MCIMAIWFTFISLIKSSMPLKKELFLHCTLLALNTKVEYNSYLLNVKTKEKSCLVSHPI